MRALLCYIVATKKAARRPPFDQSIEMEILFRCGFRSLCCFFRCLGFCGFGCCLLGGESLCCCYLFGFQTCLFVGKRLTLGLVQLAGARTGVFDDTGSLAATVAQVVELRAANLTAANDFNAFDQRGVDREYALDAFAVGNLANGEAFGKTAAGTGDANAFVSLNTGTVTFRHANVDAQGVARRKLGQGALCFDLGGLFGFQLLNDVGHVNL
ncbi:conserved hypothetical protein [Agrobacterium deltaense NCPPB 1641]|uniref:Uncharacterized protein n=1 Tax=Agrobacterium deltaense NCPPB 1641 TaxID=1183425 RepID=A0A1S7TQX4_9HYPH|nr:conserved hypothetical protein [Agrobacterium deltaense NCPPB 1641]